jgi:hypothetical protein
MKKLLLALIMLLPLQAQAKDWKLNLPVNSQGGFTGNAIELYPVVPYAPYYTISNTGRLVFMTPSDGAKTTTNTKYARTEYREMANGTEAGWQLAATNDPLRITDVSIDSLPCGTKTVIGQIHGTSNELVRLYADNPSSSCGNIRLYFHNDVDYANGVETRFYLKDANGVFVTVQLGEQFDYTIAPTSAKITVAAYKSDGSKYWASDRINPYWLTDTLYYKVGNYYQTITTGLTSTVSFGTIR